MLRRKLGPSALRAQPRLAAFAHCLQTYCWLSTCSSGPRPRGRAKRWRRRSKLSCVSESLWGRTHFAPRPVRLLPRFSSSHSPACEIFACLVPPPPGWERLLRRWQRDRRAAAEPNGSTRAKLRAKCVSVRRKVQQATHHVSQVKSLQRSCHGPDPARKNPINRQSYKPSRNLSTANAHIQCTPGLARTGTKSYHGCHGQLLKLDMPNNQRNEQPTNKLDPAETHKLAGWLAGWLDWLDARLLGCLVGGLVTWLLGWWLAGWLVGL